MDTSIDESTEGHTSAPPGSTPPGSGSADETDLLRAVCNATTDAIFIKDLWGRYLYVNPTCARLFGATPEAVVGTVDDVWFGPEVGKRLRGNDQRIITRGRAETYDEELEVGGRRFVFSTTRAPYLDDSGRVAGVVATARDITSTTAAHLELQAQRDRLEGIAASSPGALCSMRWSPGEPARYTYVSAGISKIYGLPSEEIAKDAQAMTRFIHPEDLERVRVSFMQSAQTMTPWRCEFRVANREVGEIWVEGHMRPHREAGDSLCWHGTLVDISERRAREAELRASESTLRAVVETVPDFLILVGRDRRIRYINRVIPGYTRDEVIGADALDFIVPAMRDGIAAAMARVVATGKLALNEAATLNPDGSESWYNFRIGPVIEDGRVVAVALAATDVNETRFAEQTLRTSEERYRKLVELLPDAVFVNNGTEISFCNAAFARLVGAESADELIGKSPFSFIAPEGHARIRARIAFMKQHNEPVSADEEIVVGLDGRQRRVSVVATPIVDGKDQSFLVVMHDITERKKLEDEFRQAHKMEAFGQLAGGVAHDFNNLLTVILSESEFVLSEVARDHPAFPAVADILEAGRRAASLTRQLLAFSRKTVLEPRVLDINGVVRETEMILRRLIGEDILLATKLAPNLEQVNVDPGQLSQVLMNLAVNSRDAMPKGGRLEIETSNVVVDDANHFEGLAPGRYVRLWFRDTGGGMPPEIRDRVFQPFFTTKEVGKGTGLGLAVVHGIVAQSGGAIRVQSEVGLGTTFEVLLPATELAARRPHREQTTTDAPASETVLLVEDDEAVRRLALRVLKRKGYRVLLARDGEEALRLLAEDRDRIDLLVTDVVMPNMDGQALGEAVRERFPDLKILYVSGYTDDMLVRRGLLSAEVDFLAKPYTPSSLNQAIREALSKR